MIGRVLVAVAAMAGSAAAESYFELEGSVGALFVQHDCVMPQRGVCPDEGLLFAAGLGAGLRVATSERFGVAARARAVFPDWYSYHALLSIGGYVAIRPDAYVELSIGSGTSYQFGNDAGGEIEAGGYMVGLRGGWRVHRRLDVALQVSTLVYATAPDPAFALRSTEMTVAFVLPIGGSSSTVGP